MTFPNDPRERLPRGDRDRRVSLGLRRDELAAEIGITAEQLRRYEATDSDFNIAIADRVGAALERLEAVRIPIVCNGPVPIDRAAPPQV